MCDCWEHVYFVVSVVVAYVLFGAAVIIEFCPAQQQPHVPTADDDGDHRMLPEWMKGHVTANNMVRLCHALASVNTARAKLNDDGSTKKNIGNHYADHEIDVFPAITHQTQSYFDFVQIY
jgi:hypothetical protein